MRIQFVFGIFLLCLSPVLLHAQEQKNQYVWNRQGVAVYATPSASTVLDTLIYGSEINILEVGKVVEIPLFKYESDTISHMYVPSSRWLMIEFGDRERGYIPDTYLLPHPPNITTEMMDEYFKQLSDIVHQRSEDKTEHFCYQLSYVYKNEIHYSFTDLGPCDACGHSLTKIILPGWSMRQAFVFITNFNNQLWDLDGTPIEQYLDHVPFIEKEESHSAQFRWNFIFDQVTLIEKANGVEIRIDTML